MYTKRLVTCFIEYNAINQDYRLIFRKLIKLHCGYGKSVLDQTWKALCTKFGPHWKGRESSYQVRQILALFCKLVALILGQNCVKDLSVTKIVKQIKFEGGLRWVGSKNLFPETIIHKIFETNSSFHLKQCTSFHVKQRTMGEVRFLFFRRFLLVLAKF